MADIFTDDFRTTPYWWDHSPLPDSPPGNLPARADAVVIGAGYTGLHAALQIARGHRSVVVLEAGALGQGCSTRNGGQISHSIKPRLAALTRRHGAKTAARIIAEGAASRAFVEDFIRTERIDCDFHSCGRFHAAISKRAYRELELAAAQAAYDPSPEMTMIPRTSQRSELGTDLYHGGAVFHGHASLDPGRYYAGLLDRVRETAASLMPLTPALALSEDSGGVTVTTGRGRIEARDVVIASNGYTAKVSPWHRRRILPIGSYIIGTEPLPEKLVNELFPTDRIVSDSRRVIYYYRTSPDRRRVLFGGRVTAGETGLQRSARRLFAELVRIFPPLEAYRVSHSWMGRVAYTFDTLAHTGSRGHVHYAMGYCGSGVGMASYLGMKRGRGVLGLADGQSALETPPFPARPFYFGRPWFLPAAVETFRLLDRVRI